MKVGMTKAVRKTGERILLLRDERSDVSQNQYWIRGPNSHGLDGMLARFTLGTFLVDSSATVDSYN